MAIALISCLLLPFSFWRLELLDFSRKADFPNANISTDYIRNVGSTLSFLVKELLFKILFRSLSTCSERVIASFFFFLIMNHFF